jgi:hypothetical protein
MEQDEGAVLAAVAGGDVVAVGEEVEVEAMEVLQTPSMHSKLELQDLAGSVHSQPLRYVMAWSLMSPKKSKEGRREVFLQGARTCVTRS